MANVERKTVMGAAAAAAGRQRARGGSGAVADELFSGDQGHLFPACLVLNADFSPLSYVPLSLWSWKDTVRAVFRGSAQVVSEYDEWIIRSPNLDLNLPSVIALKARPPPHSHTIPPTCCTLPPTLPPTRTVAAIRADQQYAPASVHPPQCLPARRVHLPGVSAARMGLATRLQKGC